jgi:hypothetical protein
MSRSKPTEERAKNPAEMFLEWKSALKSFVYYDKEKKENVSIPTDTKFIVLDQLSTVTGFDDTYGTGYWSNEVRYVGNEELAVCVWDTKSKGKRVLAKGLWKDIKGSVGAKYAKSIYCMAKIDGEYKLINLKVSGASLTAWIKFTEEAGGDSALYGETVVGIKEIATGKKGAVTYHYPIFEVASKKLSQEAMDQAQDMDKRLQSYLDSYLGHEESPALTEEEDDDVPYDDDPVQEIVDQEILF